ncbi:alpha/beta fold hydrolase [Roseibium denhamense]|uniref:Pimeloyl-ACP methyl ester carboxylesterase n=1 Tax=Roseibium denhamense TaxID=76305 RepID=A0ABY1PHD0_9HYPH|nr:alpha/beta hydrolase [Roseibium denhamense]SMP33658.1 Pimeloyl-ACP methyl ester carboxylesterase [Roseibium denhamense]
MTYDLLKIPAAGILSILLGGTAFAGGAYFEVEPGVDLYYEVHGTGKPVVFVPGWTFTTEVFENQIDVFSNTHKVITFDPRSHGRSTVTLEGNTYAQQGADLVKLLEHLEAEKPVLVGWSFGCLATWEYIKLKSAEAAAAHMCIDLSPTPMTAGEGDWTEGSIEDIAGLYNAVQTAQGHRDIVNWYADELMIDQEYTPELSRWIVGQSTNSPPWIAAAYWASGNFSNYMDIAKEVDAKMPSVFVVAEHWADIAEPYLATHTPNSDVHVFGGHMMFWEYPEKFNPILEAMIARAE